MKTTKALSMFIRNPFRVIKFGLRLEKEERHKQNVQAKFGLTQLPTINLLDLLKNEEVEVFPYSYLAGTSLPTDILLLKVLAKRFEECNYLEIGSWRGESITNVAQVAKKCVAVTLSEDEMRQIGLSEGFVRVHGAFSEGTANIQTIEANSYTFDFDGLNQKFDLIFVDGDHSYEGVLNDTKKVFSLRKDTSSIIVWHDYGSNTEDVRYTVLEAILSGIPEEKRKHLYHVSNTLCAVYIENETFETTKTQFPTYPDKVFSVKVKAEKFTTKKK